MEDRTHPANERLFTFARLPPIGDRLVLQACTADSMQGRKMQNPKLLNAEEGSTQIAKAMTDWRALCADGAKNLAWGARQIHFQEQPGYWALWDGPPLFPGIGYDAGA